jgi:hypothetical protein
MHGATIKIIDCICFGRSYGLIMMMMMMMIVQRGLRSDERVCRVHSTAQKIPFNTPVSRHAGKTPLSVVIFASFYTIYSSLSVIVYRNLCIFFNNQPVPPFIETNFLNARIRLYFYFYIFR